jgi:hypothetical protein
LGFCGTNFGINNGVIKMKKYTFKGILLAMGLVFATLSVQAQETRPGMIYCCENVDLDSVSARYINDSTFEIHVKADENLHFLDVNVLSGTYNKLIKNNALPGALGL